MTLKVNIVEEQQRIRRYPDEVLEQGLATDQANAPFTQYLAAIELSGRNRARRSAMLAASAANVRNGTELDRVIQESRSVRAGEAQQPQAQPQPQAPAQPQPVQSFSQGGMVKPEIKQSYRSGGIVRDPVAERTMGQYLADNRLIVGGGIQQGLPLMRGEQGYSYRPTEDSEEWRQKLEELKAIRGPLTLERAAAQQQEDEEFSPLAPLRRVAGSISEGVSGIFSGDDDTPPPQSSDAFTTDIRELGVGPIQGPEDPDLEAAADEADKSVDGIDLANMAGDKAAEKTDRLAKGLALARMAASVAENPNFVAGLTSGLADAGEVLVEADATVAAMNAHQAAEKQKWDIAQLKLGADVAKVNARIQTGSIASDTDLREAVSKIVYGDGVGTGLLTLGPWADKRDGLPDEEKAAFEAGLFNMVYDTVRGAQASGSGESEQFTIEKIN